MSNTATGLVSIGGLEPQQGFLSFEGPVDSTASSTFAANLRVLIHDYKYEVVVLKIDSPGGSLVELRKMIREIRAAKRAGVRVLACSNSLAGSAAAVLLCLGSKGGRSMNPDATLLFHFGRWLTSAGTQLTADVAGMARNQLQAVDRWILNEIYVELCMEAGSAELFYVDLAHRGSRILEQFDRLMIDLYMLAPTADRQRTDRATLKSLCELPSKEAKVAEKQYFNLLKKEFERDTPINLAVAYAMGFIDVIDHIDLDVAPRAECAVEVQHRSRPSLRH